MRDRQFICQNNGSSSKLLLAIVLFILLDCSVLGINFWLTAQIERDALAINIAGRQRMLSQQMTKAILQLKGAPSSRTVRKELSDTHNLFSTTLDSFLYGGYVVDTEGVVRQFDKLSDEQAIRIVTHAAEVFQPFSQAITLLEGSPAIPILNDAVQIAVDTNLVLLERMNLLTTRMQTLSASKTQLIRRVQTAAFLLALLNFAIIIWMFQCRIKEDRLQAARFLDLLDNASAAMIVVDDENKIILANKMSQELFGYPAHLFLSMGVDNLIRRVKGSMFGFHRNGESFRIELNTRPYRLKDKSLTIITVSDISKYANEHQRLAHLASHDPLTGLVNRRAFFDRLELEVLRARRSGKLVGVFFLDLNKFKEINDNFGHITGDQVLKSVSERLQTVVRETDTVARFAGDEFVVILADITHKNELMQVKNKLQNAFADPIQLKDREEYLSCSIGMAIYPLDAQTASELIEIADQKMYQGKQTH